MQGGVLMLDLKQRRTELGLTMLDVAKLVGVSEATISRYESGNIKNMRRDRIEKYAKALQVSPSDFLDISEEITPVEPKEEEETELSKNEREMIEIFKGLTPTQQGKLIERAKIMSEDNETEAIAKENAS